MEGIATCAMCNRAVESGAGYVVRIDVFADPELPPVTADELASADTAAALAAAIEEAKNMSADELQDGVHRRFEFRLCPSCHRKFLANPLGMPRKTRIGTN